MDDSGIVADDSGEKDPIVKIYEELLESKERTFKLEQRIRRIEKTASEGENTLKIAEETIRATCHYLRESSKIIEFQAAKITNSDEKSKETEERIKAEFVKFEEILEKVGKSTKSDWELKMLADEIHKSGKIQSSDSKKIQNQLNKFANALSTSSSATENFESEIKEVKIQLIEGQRSQEKNGIRQNDQLQELRDHLEKLSENQELKEIKNELKEIMEKRSLFDKKLKKRLEKFEENQKSRHVALENMIKEQLTQFMEEVKKQTSCQFLSSDRKRSSVISPFDPSPSKRKLSISDAKKDVGDNQTNSIKIPERSSNNETHCIFCDDSSHGSMYCREFSSFYKREYQLKQKKICIRCLVPEGAEHNPCPNAEEACPNCDDGFPIPHDTTHHHLLVCKKIPSPDVLQQLHSRND